MQITKLSPAKLNLFLHIINKRHDGYHDLQTVFLLLNWGDCMRFEKSVDKMKKHDSPVRLHCNVSLTENPMDNLIIRSAYALIEAANVVMPLPIIDIYLDKKIPTGAGLGGGSSNAATTLMVLNELWQLNVSHTQLQQIGMKLGADVPIFIYGQHAIAEGIGEILTPIDLPKQKFLLLTPSTHVSTAELFAHPKLQRNFPKLSTSQINQQKTDFLYQLNPPYDNVFQKVVCDLSQEVTDALTYLRQLETVTKSTARMTGSGSCVFLPIPFDTDEAVIQNWLKNSPCTAVVVNSL